VVHSMTGFGNAHLETEQYRIAVELRSVNHRSLKVVCRLSEAFAAREVEIERILRERVSRGAVYVNLTFEDLTGDPGFHIDTAVLETYFREIRQMKRDLGDETPPTVESLLSLPGVLVRSNAAMQAPDSAWNDAATALRQALDGLVDMRAAEGSVLWAAILEHGERIGTELARIEAQLPQAREQCRVRLRERLDAALKDRQVCVDDATLSREMAVLAERADIAEELQRLRSHAGQLEAVPGEGMPCGRKLEFLVQEMFREANTMASKVNDDQVLHAALAIKNEVDKLREQAQNVE